MQTLDPSPTQGDPWWRPWYRFLWPFQYFRDVTCGSPLERALNYRHNRAMRVYLPGFILKWMTMTLLWFAFGSLTEQTMELVALAAGFFVTATCSATVVIKLVVAWVWLWRFPELY